MTAQAIKAAEELSASRVNDEGVQNGHDGPFAKSILRMGIPASSRNTRSTGKCSPGRPRSKTGSVFADWR